MAGLPRHSAWLAWAALAITACVRVVGPSRSVDAVPLNLRLGEACTQPADCNSGVCSQGLCCDRRCDGVESCGLPGTRGVCTARTLGKPCEDTSQCLEGTCNPDDHVCCATLCEGNCVTCKGTQPGTCTPVADNEDPRNRCGNADAGVCTACVGGVCLPTAPGTDPHGVCPNGTACGVTGTCLTAGGGPCVQDADCGAGNCVAGVCLRPLREDILSARFSPESQFIRLVGFDLDESGTAHALVHQTWLGPGSSPREFSRLYLIHRTTFGAWSGEVLRASDECDRSPFVPESAITHVGEQPVVVALDAPLFSGQRCGPFPPLRVPNGSLALWWYDGQGQLTTRAQLPNPPEGDLEAGYWARTAYDGANRVVVAFNANVAGRSSILQGEFLLSTGSFAGPAVKLAESSSSAPGDLVLVGSQPVVFSTGDSAYRITAFWLDPVLGPQQEFLATNCDATRVYAVTAEDNVVHYSADCDPPGTDYRGTDPAVGTFTLTAAPGSRFQAASLPRAYRALTTATLILGANSLAMVRAESQQPVRLEVSGPGAERTFDLGRELGPFHNVPALTRGRTGQAAYVAWTQDLTDGTQDLDNVDVMSATLHWALFYP